MDWYPWHLDLHDMDAGHLTCLEDGAYRRLIDRYMRTRKPLPDDDTTLARLVGLTPDEWSAIAPQIRPFFQPKGGKLHHKRCNHELDEQDRRATKQTEKSIKGAKARWLKEKGDNAQGMPKALPDAISQALPEAIPQAMPDDCLQHATGNAKSMPGYATETKTETKKEFGHSAVSYDLAGARDPTSTAQEEAREVKTYSQVSSADKLRRIDEIFAGSGAVIVGTARFGDWERWGYDWHLDVEPTLMEIAARKGPEWKPRKLDYFDEPIRERYKARLGGTSVGSWRGHPRERGATLVSVGYRISPTTSC
jgi:uncharacterized protein YdaU (DUF1376 family)